MHTTPSPLWYAFAYHEVKKKKKKKKREKKSDAWMSVIKRHFVFGVVSSRKQYLLISRTISTPNEWLASISWATHSPLFSFSPAFRHVPQQHFAINLPIHVVAWTEHVVIRLAEEKNAATYVRGPEPQTLDLEFKVQSTGH